MAGPHGILAGYDGSPGADQALGWAAREARARKVVLTVCHAYGPASPVPASAAAALAVIRQGGEQVLARGVHRAQALMPPGQVRSLLSSEQATAALCGHSSAAEMVVVGSRGRGILPGLLLGSVSSQVAAHAHGPTVVVRGHWWPNGGCALGPVVAGADGSQASAAAVRFAVEEAEVHGTYLLALCALADSPGRIGGALRMEEEFDEQMTLAEKEHPTVQVLRQISRGQPRSALLEAAAGAQILVIGARGRGGLEEMLLGSVSQTLVHHASCPVAIARPRDARRS